MERTSTSSGGLSSTLQIPQPELVYKDSTGQLWSHIIDGKLFIHAHLTTKNFRRHLDTLLKFQTEVKEFGIDELYTYVDSPERFRYAEFMGFETTCTIFEKNGKVCEIMKKVLN